MIENLPKIYFFPFEKNKGSELGRVFLKKKRDERTVHKSKNVLSHKPETCV